MAGETEDSWEPGLGHLLRFDFSDLDPHTTLPSSSLPTQDASFNPYSRQNHTSGEGSLSGSQAASGQDREERPHHDHSQAHHDMIMSQPLLTNTNFDATHLQPTENLGPFDNVRSSTQLENAFAVGSYQPFGLTNHFESSVPPYFNQPELDIKRSREVIFLHPLHNRVTDTRGQEISEARQNNLSQRPRVSAMADSGRPPATRVPLPEYHTPGKRPASALEVQPTPKRPRKKFSTKRRREVATVRKKGACLLCRIRRVPCSGESPCKTCTDMKAACRGTTPLYRIMDCVPCSWSHVNVFANDFFLTSEGCASLGSCALFPMELLRCLSNAPIVVDADEHVAECATWLCGGYPLATVSSQDQLNAMLQLNELISSVSTLHISECFTWFIFMVLIAYDMELNNSNIKARLLPHMWDLPNSSRFDRGDLYLKGFRAGSQWLEELQALLTPTKLAQQSLRGLKVLFLVLCRTVFAVRYYLDHMTPESHGLLTQQTEYAGAKAQMINILHHYLLLIGRRTQLLEEMTVQHLGNLTLRPFLT